MTELNQDRAATLFGTRIIAGAFIAGCVMFLGITFFLRSNGTFDRDNSEFDEAFPETVAEDREADSARDDILHWVLLAIGFGAVGAHVIVPGMIRKQQGATLDSFRVMTIMRMASAEGVALFGTVCYMLSGRPLGGGVALGMIGFMMLLQFPTGARLDAWLEQRDG